MELIMLKLNAGRSMSDRFINFIDKSSYVEIERDNNIVVKLVTFVIKIILPKLGAGGI